MSLVRSYNPIWYNVDQTGHALDDTYFLFVLNNDIPYQPIAIWQDPYGNVEWSNPIQYQSNGTLPNNLYWDEGQVYRLEIRAGNTQSDELIDLIENYVPSGTGGPSPSDEIVIPTDNQITNPQFSLINFQSPLVLTGITTQDIDIAPGWTLSVTGAGNVTVTQEPLNASGIAINPSNAPYALRLTLSGWTTARLKQRFEQAGMLWSNLYVSSSVTALISGEPQSISAFLVDSNGGQTQILAPVAVSSSFEEYKDVGLVGAPTNTDIPPDAWVEYQLVLPVNVDIYLTSFQLVAGNQNVTYSYDQDTIERQIDNTFHYFKDSLLYNARTTILPAWSFGLNPWQFSDPTVQNTFGSGGLGEFGYTADNTIVVQQAYVDSSTGGNISFTRATDAQNYGFQITAVKATNQFAMIYYLDSNSARPFWNENGYLSSMVKLFAQKQNAGATLGIKMRVLYRTSQPATLAQNEPIASWTALGEPVYSAGWTAISPLNDPTFYVESGNNTFMFEGFQNVISSSDNMTMAIVLYTLNPMIESGTPDYLTFESVSFTPSRFAVDVNPMTVQQVLQSCQYVYRKSFPQGTLPANNTGLSGAAFSLATSLNVLTGNGGPIINFSLPMFVTPAITLYNPSVSSPPSGELIRNVTASVNWNTCTSSGISTNGFYTRGNAFGSPTESIGNLLAVHWTATCRLGN